MEIQSDAVALIPADVAKNYNFLAFAKDGNVCMLPWFNRMIFKRSKL